jgi:outer membrane PBP1 activator LpoA protein
MHKIILHSPDVLLIVTISVILAGCSTSVVSSNPRNVVVESQSLNAKEAQRLADAECSKHNRYAKMTIKGDYWDRHYTFECIE